MDQRAPEKQAVDDNAMPVLVHRLGGEVTISQADFDELAAAYGGYENLAVAAELRDGVLRLWLTRNPSSERRLTSVRLRFDVRAWR